MKISVFVTWLLFAWIVP